VSPSNAVFIAVALVGFYTTWKLSTAPSFRFSPALLFYAIFFFMQVVGCAVVVNEANRMDRLARLGLGLGSVGFALGLASVSVWSNYRPAVELAGVRARFDLDEPHLPYKVAIMCIGYLICCSILAYFYKAGGGIPLLQGISALAHGDQFLTAQILLKERRLQMTYFESSSYRGQGYIDQFRTIVLPYVVANFLVWSGRSKSKRWRALGVLALLPPALFLAGTGQRHPILTFALTLSILGYLMAPPRLHRRIVGVSMLAGFVMFSVMTFMLGRYGHTGSFRTDLPMVLVGLRDRIFFANSIGTISLFHLFPNPEPFRWGWTWISDLQGFLPGPHVGFSAWLYRRLYGAVGTAAPMSFGEMYANFGLPGVFFGAAALGMVLQLLQVFWTRRRRYRAEDIVMYCMLSISFAWCAAGGLLNTLQRGLMALPMLYVLVQVGRDVVIVILHSRYSSWWTGPSFPVQPDPVPAQSPAP
jgi:oligosaccharide repeat unit polymerase